MQRSALKRNFDEIYREKVAPNSINFLSNITKVTLFQWCDNTYGQTEKSSHFIFAATELPQRPFTVFSGSTMRPSPASENG